MLEERDKGGTTRESKTATWVSFLERFHVDLFPLPKNQAEPLFFLVGSEAEDVEGEDFRVAEEDKDDDDDDDNDDDVDDGELE